MNFGFEFTESPLVLPDRRRQIFFGESWLDVLWTVDVPGMHVEDNGSLDAPAILVVG